MSSIHSDTSVLLHMNIHKEPNQMEEDPYNYHGHWSSDKIFSPPMVVEDPIQEDPQGAMPPATLESHEAIPIEANLDPPVDLPPVVEQPTKDRVTMTPEELLHKVHGGRNLHFGARRTWLLLNKQYPGHRIPYRFVQDFISNCAVCQKDRLGMTDGLEPVIRHIKPPHQRSRVGVDRLTVTPADKQGILP